MLFDISHLGERNWRLETRKSKLGNREQAHLEIECEHIFRSEKNRSKGKTQKAIQFLSVALPFAFCALHFDLLFGPGGLAKPRGHSQLLVSIV
jgi:hypothetical protein